ncbi:MAG: hypothetical protein OEQ18_16320 [Gammaproteobacteria bacterium]|nr:hypothetical protein [Gammaproteobacteria bacterium]
MNKLSQVILAFAPVLMTPLLVYGLAEGWLDFGAGEKDVLAALPWFIGSVVFALSAVVLIMKGWNLVRWMRRSAVLSTAVIAGLAIIAYMTSWLGVAAPR